MIDFSQWIQSHLSSLDLPVYNEFSIQQTTSTPCITWRLENDFKNVWGDNLGFDYIQFSIKLWCNNLAIQTEYIPQISDLLRQLGLSLISTNTLSAGGVTQIETRWRGMYRENYE